LIDLEFSNVFWKVSEKCTAFNGSGINERIRSKLLNFLNVIFFIFYDLDGPKKRLQTFEEHEFEELENDEVEEDDDNLPTPPIDDEFDDDLPPPDDEGKDDYVFGQYFLSASFQISAILRMSYHSRRCTVKTTNSSVTMTILMTIQHLMIMVMLSKNSRIPRILTIFLMSHQMMIQMVVL
jgi:hypothetical protein